MARKSIFISYRQADTLLWPLLIANELRRQRAMVDVFVDKNSNRLGEDYEKRCLETAALSDVVLALVGDQWSGQASSGVRRIDSEKDLLRREILSGETGGALVIPVLLEKTSWSDLEPLPQQLIWLPLRESERLASDDPEAGVNVLVSRLFDEELISRESGRQSDRQQASSVRVITFNNVNVSR